MVDSSRSHPSSFYLSLVVPLSEIERFPPLPGNQVPKDETEAGRWFLAAAKAGCQTGALAAGIWLLEGRGGLEASAEAAYPHLKVAHIPIIAPSLSQPIFSVQSETWPLIPRHQVAADHGISRGQTMLGILTLEGKGVEKNSAAAAKLFEKASADNDHVAMYELSCPCLHSLTLACISVSSMLSALSLLLRVGYLHAIVQLAPKLVHVPNGPVFRESPRPQFLNP